MKKTLFALLAFSSFAVAGSALGAAPGDSGFYVGGGVSSNDLDVYNDEATGYQFFGGYDLAKAGLKAPPFKLAVEGGYMNSGDFDVGPFSYEVDGLWATGVAAYPVSREVDLIGRLGLDFGDDDGLMFGVGVGFNANRQIQLRGEYVIRDHLDSLQFNVAFRL